MGVPQEYRNALHISLIGKDNQTYKGTLVLKNWTYQYPGPLVDVSPDPNSSLQYDPTGASYYVIAVVLVYGLSIVALIASHMSRNQHKIEQDKQIHKYFQEFMFVQEESSREDYQKLKTSIVKKLMWENNPTYRNLSRVIIPAIAVPVGGYLLTVTSEQELDALRRDRISPAPSITDQSSVIHNNKQRRKGLGNLFTAAPPRDFELSVLERLTELKEIRQEVRARANSVAFLNASAFDISGMRCSEAESGSESNMDNQSEDSHVTLPALTISPDPIPLQRWPLPTIADTEDKSNCSSDNDEEDDDDDDDDDDEHQMTDREDIWLMGSNGRVPKSYSQQRRVHFSSSANHSRSLNEELSDNELRTSRRMGENNQLTLVRQNNVISDSDSDEDQAGDNEETSDSESDDENNENNLHKITSL